MASKSTSFCGVARVGTQYVNKTTASITLRVYEGGDHKDHMVEPGQGLDIPTGDHRLQRVYAGTVRTIDQKWLSDRMEIAAAT